MKVIKIADENNQKDRINYFVKDNHYLAIFPKEELKLAKDKLSFVFSNAGIYIYIGLKNNYRYVGQTVNLDQRTGTHKSQGDLEKDFEFMAFFGMENGNLSKGQLDLLESDWIGNFPETDFDRKNATQGNKSFLSQSDKIDAENLNRDILEMFQFWEYDVFTPNTGEDLDTPDEKVVADKVYQFEVSDGAISGKSNKSLRLAYINYLINFYLQNKKEVENSGLISEGEAKFATILAKNPPIKPYASYKKIDNTTYLYSNLSANQAIKKVLDFAEKMGRQLVEKEN
ncbi:GIY-YIG nuclease family protein [Lactococcus allomyrinae]|uniref:GIY-YIG nuclease family protein n=1 Tax=Lactococcus allomyrinae TaxID=2419773 RepID=A0A387BNY7_9LACT|nr:GIY-YIG nuclease family protein [Lactococcus allomyrinae]AYG00251.1 GIY-YIG nuclease family protein [Lactococcus allomyrinae]